MTEIWDLYRKHPSFVLGFHGCDRTVGEEVLQGGHLRPSENKYDWLGHGIYFWEGSPERAMQFATEAATENARISQGEIKDPFVVGAIIDLGRCANLMDSAALDEVREAYEALVDISNAAGEALPKNTGGDDKLRRNLDCEVINTMHKLRAQMIVSGAPLPPYQTVKSNFLEGGELFDGSMFSRKSHIQIAVRDLDCIQGYFRPILKGPFASS